MVKPLVAVAALALSGCLSVPSSPNVLFPCPDQQCPIGQACALDGFCHALASTSTGGKSVTGTSGGRGTTGSSGTSSGGTTGGSIGGTSGSSTGTAASTGTSGGSTSTGGSTGTSTGGATGTSSAGTTGTSTGGTTGAACVWTFAPQVTYSVGGDPEYVATADFNGDGKADLVAANAFDSTVSVLLNVGDGGDGGTFAPQVTYAVGQDPWTVAVGDFNDDGQPDLAVVSKPGDTVGVLLNLGNGTFAPLVSYATGNGPQFVAVGDFNDDGWPDLVVANGLSDTVSVLLNLGDGGGAGVFAPQVSYGVGPNPRSVAVGDFDGNGALDLAVANQDGATVSVLLGNGGGTFGAQATLAVGGAPQSVAVGDFNGDGWPDLAVANVNSGTVSVLLNVGDGGAGGAFAPQVTYLVGQGPQGVAVGDFNHDGWPDLATANGNFSSTTISVLLNLGVGGAFAPQATYTVGSAPSSVAVLDLTGDGGQDLASANYLDKTVSVLRNVCQ